MELARIAALLEEDLANGGAEEDIERVESDTEAEGLGDEERTANLSIIGEEEEEEDTATLALKVIEVPLATTSSLVIPETQYPATNIAIPSSSEEALPTPAKDVAIPSANAEETAVPLNDNPSTLRNIFSASLPASANGSNRTPGGTSNRYIPSAYSAAKPSGVMSSSPPQAHNAPSSFSGFGRPSTGKLIFAPLPNRSMGMGPSLGRSVGSWTAGESQGSQTSNPTTSAPISTGGTKRPSMSGADVPNKTSRKTMDSVANESAPKSVLESLNGRLQALQNRSSTVPRASMFPIPPTVKAAATLAPAPVAVPEPTSTLETRLVSPEDNVPPTVTPVVTRPSSPKPFAKAATPIVTGFKPTLSTSSKPLPLAPGVAAPALIPSLRRQNSVTNLVAALESKHDTRVPSPIKGYAASPRSPRSPRTLTNYTASQIARPISPSPINSPRMMLRSPSLRNENLSRVAAKGSPLVTSFRSMEPTKEEEVEVKATTTPKGSPVKAAAGARSILQQIEDKGVEDEDEVMLVQQIKALSYEVESTTQREEQEKEESEREREREVKESRLPSLPSLPVEQGDVEDEDNDSDDESMEVAGRLIVEQGRGVMASAIDSGFKPVKKEEPRVIQVATVEKVTKVSPSKIVMPGTLFGMEDEDEYAEADASVEIMEVTQKVSMPSQPDWCSHADVLLAGYCCYPYSGQEVFSDQFSRIDNLEFLELILQ